MIGMDFKTGARQFFDAPKVKRAVDQATRRVFSKLGAFVRQTARQSIRTRKRPSTPGEPPSSHVGTLKRLIFFAYDTWVKSVVIGPTIFAGAKSKGAAPEALEHGGTERLRIKPRGRRPGRERVVMATYAPRPFMAPAFEREKKKLPGLWANSVKP